MQHDTSSALSPHAARHIANLSIAKKNENPQGNSSQTLNPKNLFIYVRVALRTIKKRLENVIQLPKSYLKLSTIDLNQRNYVLREAEGEAPEGYYRM